MVLAFLDNPYLPWNGETVPGEWHFLCPPVKVGKFKMAAIVIYDILTLVYIRPWRGGLYVFYDEAKALMGLPKLGTHKISINGSWYLIIRAPVSDFGAYTPDYDLACLGHVRNPVFECSVRELVAFCSIVGLRCTPAMVYVRVRPDSPDPPYPYIFPSDNAVKSETNLEGTFKEYFNGYSIGKTLRYMLGLRDGDNVMEACQVMGDKFTDLLERCAPESAAIKVNVVSRLQTYLLRTEERS